MTTNISRIAEVTTSELINLGYREFLLMDSSILRFDVLLKETTDIIQRGLDIKQSRSEVTYELMKLWFPVLITIYVVRGRSEDESHQDYRMYNDLDLEVEGILEDSNYPY